MSNRTALVLRLPEEVSVECLVDTILERDLRQRKDNEAKKESQAKSTVLFQFFFGRKLKLKQKEPGLLWPCVKIALPRGIL